MTDKVSKYIFRLINQETAMLISRYPDDETLINDLYVDMINNDGDEAIAYSNYITLLIKYCEQKEFYEKCNILLKLKNKIKQ